MINKSFYHQATAAIGVTQHVDDILPVMHERRISFLRECRQKGIAIAERAGIPEAQLRFTVQYLVLVLAYLVLDFGLRHLANLPEQSYFKPVIAPQMLISLSTPGAIFLILLAAIAILGRRHSLLWRPWPSAGPLRYARYLVGTVVLLLAWQYASYGYNHYFQQAHVTDRLGLLLFAVLAWRRPGFVLPFLLILIPMIMQFRFPLGGASLAEPLPLIRILIAFTAFGLITGFRKNLAPATLLVLTGSIMVTGYWISGSVKIPMDWLTKDHIAYLLPATYANGWLAFLSVDTIEQLTELLDQLNAPMKALTLLLEIGVIVIFWKRWTLIGILSACIFFHLAVFLVSGIAFWRWAVVEVLLLWLFVKKWTPATVTLHTPVCLLLSALTIIGSMLWFNPSALAWRDARMSYTYRLEAIGDSGQSYHLPPGIFAPYDYQFTLGNFNYLSNSTLLPVVWGATNARVAAALENIDSESELIDLEQSLGKNRFDNNHSHIFDTFIRSWIQGINTAGATAPAWAFIQPPPLLWTFGRGRVFDAQEPVRKVLVRRVTSFYHNRRYRELKVSVVREIDIPLVTQGGRYENADSGRR